MKKKYKVMRKKLMLGVMALTCIITVGAFAGCSIKEKVSANTSEISQGNEKEELGYNETKPVDEATTDESKPAEDTKAVDETTADKSKPVDETKAIENTKDTTKVDEFQAYIRLIGQKKDDLNNILEEEPKIIDEGGLEFENAQLRIWLDDKGLVNQVFTMNKSVDLNGVKIGEDIKKFEEVFGDALSNKNGDAHFKYGNVYLSVNYDIKTGETYAVYILKENF